VAQSQAMPPRPFGGSAPQHFRVNAISHINWAVRYAVRMMSAWRAAALAKRSLAT
jgi:hypothetical protein